MRSDMWSVIAICLGTVMLLSAFKDLTLSLGPFQLPSCDVESVAPLTYKRITFNSDPYAEMQEIHEVLMEHAYLELLDG